MTLPIALVVGATRFATLTTTHGIAHAIADAVLPTLEQIFRHRRHPMQDIVSIAFALLCTLGSFACYRHAAVLVRGEIERSTKANSHDHHSFQHQRWLATRAQRSGQ